jgi:hypothetical protein
MLTYIKTSDKIIKKFNKENLMSTIINYPGPFKHTSGDWSCRDTGDNLCRTMNFQSTVEGSAIREFSILGYKNGQVAISLKLDKAENETFFRFLEARHVQVSNLDRLTGHLLTGTYETTKIVFRILSENNQIPASHKAKIEAIIAEGRCQPWEPKGSE